MTVTVVVVVVVVVELSRESNAGNNCCFAEFVWGCGGRVILTSLGGGRGGEQGRVSPEFILVDDVSVAAAAVVVVWTLSLGKRERGVEGASSLISPLVSVFRVPDTSSSSSSGGSRSAVLVVLQLSLFLTAAACEGEA